MIKCSTCGTENLKGSQYCDECGGRLEDLNPVEKPEPQRQQSGEHVFQTASVTSMGIPLIVEDPKLERSTKEKPVVGEEEPVVPVHARLIIERGASVGAEFPLSAEESQIGRWDADNGVFPDVDLDACDPEAKVSRRHARIVHEKGLYMVEDLGSTNGTFVNRGRRLIPGNPHVLQDGDEIIVGKTFLRFQIL